MNESSREELFQRIRDLVDQDNILEHYHAEDVVDTLRKALDTLSSELEYVKQELKQVKHK